MRRLSCTLFFFIMEKKKRCLIFTNHFYPETFRCNDVAFELVKRGYEVKVLTGIPDYPQGKFHKGYSLLRRRCETINGVKVVRVPRIPRGSGSAIRMVLNYASGIFFFFFYGLYQALFYKYDCIFVHNTSPAFICLPAVLVKKIQRIPLDHWILDMWPESLAAGGIHNKTIYNMVEEMMGMIYHNCDILHISSMGFKRLLLEKGVPDYKIEYFPNFCEDTSSNTGFRSIPELPEGFKVMFAGNLGEAQNLENVLQSALRLRDEKDIHWVFVGDGRKKPWMDAFITEHHLEDTVHMMGRHPIDTMSAFFAQADVMLVSLADEVAFRLVLPAKVQAYMVNAKPILAMLNGEGQEVIQAAECGWSVNANDVDGMVDMVKHISKYSREDLRSIGNKGYTYYRENFELNMCMERLDKTLNKLINEKIKK